MATTATAPKTETSVEEKMRALFLLQQVDSSIDKIRIVRGELPLEVQDLEDEVTGMETRIAKLEEELKEAETEIKAKKTSITEAQALIKKYEGQQNNVRNNREYDSLTKEIEFQNLEIQLSEKKIKEHKAHIDTKNDLLKDAKKVMKERKDDLSHKKAELDDIVAETDKEEKSLIKKSGKAEKLIEERLLLAYKRIRGSARNGLGVVTVQRDSCGGCFAKIPPQRQLDIRSRKKVIVCEHCGRILVDPDIASSVNVDTKEED